MRMHNIVGILAVLMSMFFSHAQLSAPGSVLPAHTSKQVTTQNTQLPQQGTSLSQRTKTTGCAAAGGLQDIACTPGAIIPTATKEQICVSGYSKSVRNVPVAEKDQVYAEYGIPSHQPGEYEVDHLVSLELGGSNDISNLWPEAAAPTPGFHQKDAVENYLHSQVCSGAISLQQAQQEIATNWLQVYQSAPNVMQYNHMSSTATIH